MQRMLHENDDKRNAPKAAPSEASQKAPAATSKATAAAPNEDSGADSSSRTLEWAAPPDANEACLADAPVTQVSFRSALDAMKSADVVAQAGFQSALDASASFDELKDNLSTKAPPNADSKSWDSESDTLIPPGYPPAGSLPSQTAEAPKAPPNAEDEDKEEIQRFKRLCGLQAFRLCGLAATGDFSNQIS